MRKWIYSVLITILLAGGAVLCAIRWQAWFGMPIEPLWTGDTIDYVFPYPTAQQSYSPQDDLTAQRSYSDSVLTILILGDVHNRLRQADYDTLAARVPEVDAVAQVGDWLDRGQNYYYQLLVREWTNSALNGVPVIACPGNHEYSKGVNKALSPVWEHAFPHPDNGPRDVPGASFFVDFPHLRFIVIDSNPLARMVYLTRTLTWLRQTMKGANDRFIVVMMHHPVIAVGKGRVNPHIYAAFRHALGETDLVLAGHDHSYMRTKQFVVLNTAGNYKPQHLYFTPDKTDSVPTYSVLSVTDSLPELHFTTYRLSDGVAIDSLYVTHH